MIARNFYRDERKRKRLQAEWDTFTTEEKELYRENYASQGVDTSIMVSVECPTPPEQEEVEGDGGETAEKVSTRRVKKPVKDGLKLELEEIKALEESDEPEDRALAQVRLTILKAREQLVDSITACDDPKKLTSVILDLTSLEEKLRGGSESRKKTLAREQTRKTRVGMSREELIRIALARSPSEIDRVVRGESEEEITEECPGPEAIPTALSSEDVLLTGEGEVKNFSDVVDILSGNDKQEAEVKNG